MRWSVEVPRGERTLLETVIAERLDIKDSGLLVFADADYALVIAYAPTAWTTVVEEGHG
jgi:hypothetical protein